VTVSTTPMDWSDWVAANTGEHGTRHHARAQAPQVAFMLGTTEKADLSTSRCPVTLNLQRQGYFADLRKGK
jgi:hypothetical protein